MCIANKFVFLMNDFNARTCNKTVFVDADEFLTHYFSFDDSMHGSFNISSKHFLSKHMVSQDKVINNVGNMYKSNNMLILNARCGNDKEMAR